MRRTKSAVRFASLALVLLGSVSMISFGAGCASDKAMTRDAMATESTAFDSPEAAVPQIRRMLRDEQWPQLASYYDLSESSLTYEDLASGGFFLNIDTNAGGQPREISRYRHPFPPAYEFSRVIDTADPNVVIVEMQIAIDQGEGMPIQRGLTWFKMRRSDGGWRILPETNVRP